MSHRRKNIPLRDLRTYGRGRAVRLPDFDYAQDANVHLTICADRGRRLVGRSPREDSMSKFEQQPPDSHRTYGRGRAVRWDRYDYVSDAVIHLTMCAAQGKPFQNAELAETDVLAPEE